MKRITKIEPLKASSVERKLRVAAYCRVSTGAEDQLLSLETQKSHYEEYITANPGWAFAGLYYDEGISGTNKEKRPALMKMLADCEDGKIDRILTKSLSRFARNTADCLELVRKLLDLGVTIYFEKADLDTVTMESELLLSIMSSLAESESASISENNRWSIRHRFETGTFKIGSAPYGYNVHGGEFTINEEEAKWVRWIFDSAVNGKTCTMIVKELKHRPYRKLRRLIYRIPVHPCGDGRERHTPDLMIHRHLKRIPVAARQQLCLAAPSAVPHRTDGMDHIFAGKFVSPGKLCISGIAAV